MKLTGRGEKRDITLTNKFMAHGSTDLRKCLLDDLLVMTHESEISSKKVINNLKTFKRSHPD